jgi:hypothetical protein
MKRHIQRRHPNLPNYLNARSNNSSNISTEFQNYSRNNSIYISLFDKYAPLIRSNPVWYEQISRFQEVLEKIKQMNNDEIVYIIIFAKHLALKRGIR